MCTQLRFVTTQILGGKGNFSKLSKLNNSILGYRDSQENRDSGIGKQDRLLIASYYKQLSAYMKMKNHKIKTKCPDQQNWF